MRESSKGHYTYMYINHATWRTGNKTSCQRYNWKEVSCKNWVLKWNVRENTCIIPVYLSLDIMKNVHTESVPYIQ